MVRLESLVNMTLIVTVCPSNRVSLTGRYYEQPYVGRVPCLSISPAAPSGHRWQQGGPLLVRRLLVEAGHVVPGLGSSVERGKLAAQALVVVLAREALRIIKVG